MEIRIDLKRELDELRRLISTEFRQLAGTLNSRGFAGGSAGGSHGKKQRGPKPFVAKAGHFTVDQAAANYAVTRLTIYNWIKKNRLRTSRQGRNIMISESDLKDFFRRNSRINKRLSNKTGTAGKRGRPAGTGIVRRVRRRK